MTFDGSGTADGSFAIPDMPQTEYTLQFGSTYLVTNARALDLGDDLLGRPDVTAATQATPVNLNLTDLETWEFESELQLFSSNAGTFGLPSIAPEPGATTISETFDWMFDAFPPNLLDASRDDQLFITQLATRASSTGQPYQTVTRAAGPLSVTQMDGQLTTITEALNAVPQADSITMQQ